MADEQDRTDEQAGRGRERQRTDPREARPDRDRARTHWEHPADKAALQALRRIPVLRRGPEERSFGFFGEKPVRLAFQADAVRVSEKQFGEVYRSLQGSVCGRSTRRREYPLFMSQTPMVNAGAYGMDQPFHHSELRNRPNHPG